MKDCCGSCPQPKTAEEHETAAVENKIYVSGDVEFMKDDPGRQMIGSFNPLTSENWTEMGYVGNTTELCQKICDGDLEYVKEWCRAPSSSLDRRDHTGRTPLHLATQSSTPEIVRCLVDHGARIVARLVDGTTALHIAAARGNAAMVEVLLEKSEANEEDAANKESKKKAALVQKRKAENEKLQADSGENQSKDGHPNAKDTNSLTDEDEDFDSASDYESTTMTDRSFVKVKGQTVPNDEALPEDEAETEPDIYDVNVIAWDNPLSPLHIAILGGHIDVINCLIGKFGADALLPVKILNSYTHNPSHAIMTLVLAARLPQPQDHEMCKKLLSFGASTAQGDMKKISALHYLIAMQKSSLIEACFEMDEPAATSALNHIVVRGEWRPDVDSPLITSISTGDSALVFKLLDFGALPTIDFDKVALSNSFDLTGHRHDKKQVEDMSHKLRQNVNQPILLAVERDLPQVVHRMIGLGVDVNTLSSSAFKAISNYESSKNQHHGHTGESLLDLVDSKIRDLIRAKQVKLRLNDPIKLNNDQDYLDGLTPGTYEYWQIEKKLEMAKNIVHEWNAKKVEKVKSHNDDQGLKEKRKVLDHLIEEFNVLRERLLKAGAMTFTQIHPHLAPPAKQQSNPQKKESVSLILTVDFEMAGLDETLRKGYLEL